MSRDIVFGKKSLGGLGWCDMEVEQGLHNLGAMINGLHNNEIFSQVHKAIMRTWFWALGMNPPKNEISNITHDEPLWPRTTAQFMSKHNIRIVLANLSAIKRKRSIYNDISLQSTFHGLCS
jgi:hypothetical protein